jgi:hypothetical protein
MDFKFFFRKDQRIQTFVFGASLFLVVLNNTSGASFSFLSRVTEIGVIRMNSKGL